MFPYDYKKSEYQITNLHIDRYYLTECCEDFLLREGRKQRLLGLLCIRIIISVSAYDYARTLDSKH